MVLRRTKSAVYFRPKTRYTSLEMKESCLNVATHLRERGVEMSLYNSIVIAEDRATFLLYTLSGKLSGFQTYKPGAPKTTEKGAKGLSPRELRYFTYMTRATQGVLDNALFFGFETFDWRRSICFVVEGIFDAVKLHSLGFNAVAVLANAPATFRSWKRCYPHVRFVCLADNDAAGAQLAEQCDASFTVPEQFKDVGEMPLDELAMFLIDNDCLTA